MKKSSWSWLEKKIDFSKSSEQNLVPAIVQDEQTHQVLMLGYMNRSALQKTLQTGRVTFYSRSKKRLWTKGETSKHYLHWVDIRLDCDGDALLLLAHPQGPTCHRNTPSCFDPLPSLGSKIRLLGGGIPACPVLNTRAGVRDNPPPKKGPRTQPNHSPQPQAQLLPSPTFPSTDFFTRVLDELLSVIRDRKKKKPENSYTAYLLKQGIPKIAKKVGEEAVEVALSATQESKKRLIAEISDLVYHLCVLMTAKKVSLRDIAQELHRRQKA